MDITQVSSTFCQAKYLIIPHYINKTSPPQELANNYFFFNTLFYSKGTMKQGCASR